VTEGGDHSEGEGFFLIVSSLLNFRDDPFGEFAFGILGNVIFFFGFAACPLASYWLLALMS
jgi:hypothetical protein